MHVENVKSEKTKDPIRSIAQLLCSQNHTSKSYAFSTSFLKVFFHKRQSDRNEPFIRSSVMKNCVEHLVLKQ